MALTFKYKRFFRDPLSSARHIMWSSLRSSMFLTAYVTVALSTPCIFRKIFGSDKPWQYFFSGFLSGAMVFIEVPGRRLELALYCLPRAVESAWNCGVKWKYWNNLHGGEAFYFSIASGILMCLYQQDPESIHEGYRKIMLRLIGVNWKINVTDQKGFIRA